MAKNRFLDQRAILILIALTIILFIAFDVVAHVFIQTEFDDWVRDSLKFQAVETAEVLLDLEDGMSMIDDSLDYNAKRALKSHVDITLSLIKGADAFQKADDRAKEAPSQEYAVDPVSERKRAQSDVLEKIETYRQSIDGTIAVFSLDEGMLLYPDDESGRINIYFNAENKEVLDRAIAEGGLFGTISSSDMIEGSSELNGYFAFEPDWNWLIFALKKGDLADSYRTYSEYITIRDGIEHAETYNIIDSAFVLDPYYFYEFGVDYNLIGRKVSRIDLRTNKAIDEIYRANENDFAQYVVKNYEDGLDEEKIAYVLKTEDSKHIVVVEADVSKKQALVKQIIFKVRLMTLIAILALMCIMYLLYQNFITLVDPIAVQQGGRG